MRIISGKFRGRNLIAPASLPVRPTTDYAKSALFNILTNVVDFDALKVLDLFCGTGNISFEFASRGTTNITCVDGHTACIRFVKGTAERLGIDGLHTVRSDVFKYIRDCGEQFDLIFADPPFDFERTDELPDLIFERRMLRDEGVLIIEHQSKRKLQSNIPVSETRLYGNCAFSFYRPGPAE